MSASLYKEENVSKRNLTTLEVGDDNEDESLAITSMFAAINHFFYEENEPRKVLEIICQFLSDFESKDINESYDDFKTLNIDKVLSRLLCMNEDDEVEVITIVLRFIHKIITEKYLIETKEFPVILNITLSKVFKSFEDISDALNLLMKIVSYDKERYQRFFYYIEIDEFLPILMSRGLVDEALYILMESYTLHVEENEDYVISFLLEVAQNCNEEQKQTILKILASINYSNSVNRTILLQFVPFIDVNISDPFALSFLAQMFEKNVYDPSIEEIDSFIAILSDKEAPQEIIHQVIDVLYSIVKRHPQNVGILEERNIFQIICEIYCQSLTNTKLLITKFMPQLINNSSREGIEQFMTPDVASVVFEFLSYGSETELSPILSSILCIFNVLPHSVIFEEADTEQLQEFLDEIEDSENDEIRFKVSAIRALFEDEED